MSHDGDITDTPVPSKPSRPPTVDVRLSGLSHQGKIRENNEDQFYVARISRSLETMLTTVPAGEIPSQADTVGYILIVADGMGGAAAGEVASGMAIRTLVDVLLDVPDWVMRLDEAGVAEVARRAGRYYEKVNAELSRLASQDPQLTGMGTTMTVSERSYLPLI